jgi:hypothetical protein
MKVYMGPYPDNWWRSSIHSDYMNRKYKYEWTENKTKFEDFLERVEDTLQVIYNATINKVIKNRKRKIKVHIDGYDLWGMDNTLAHIIHPMLVKMRDQKQGTPFTDDEDVPEHIRSTAAKPKENDWDTDEFHDARWEYILGEMIHAFECELDDNWEEKFYSGKSDFIFQKWDGGSGYEMKEGPNHTFKVDRDGLAQAWKRRQEGLRLFGKYYHSLWT